MKNLIFLAVWAVLLSPATLWAAENALPKDRNLHVTSDTMISERSKGFVEFTGNAKATSQDSIINADSIKVFLYKDEEKKQLRKESEQNIKEIIATGNVQFLSEDRKAFADKAVYTTLSQVLVLTGEAPKVITGENYITGKKITLFRENGKVVVESGKEKRVEAEFRSKDKAEKKEVQ